MITVQEDDCVIDLVARYGVKSWSLISTHLTGRLGKQCRERWYNHLSPKISKNPWTLEEDRVIVEVITYTYTYKYLILIIYCINQYVNTEACYFRQQMG